MFFIFYHRCWWFGTIGEWRNLITGKALLVIGGTRTQVCADSITVAASALNHCATMAPNYAKMNKHRAHRMDVLLESILNPTVS